MMDKSKIKPYQSEEELYENVENIDKEWKKEKYKNHEFSARHIIDDPEHPENCLHLYFDEKDRICSTNRNAFVRHMLVDEGLTPTELASYERRLALEFTFWKHIEKSKIHIEQAQKEIDNEYKATSVFLAAALSRKSKYKN